MKTIQIQGQTIELPFTEAEYQEIPLRFDAISRRSPEKSMGDKVVEVAIDTFGQFNFSEEYDAACTGIAIGLHLAEMEKQGEIEKLRAENSKLWHPMETAPKTGEVIEITYGGGESCLAFWSDRPVCMLGSTNGGFPAGWATAGPNVDSNLPLDTPEFWRPEQ